ncbi:MAG: hypothetical protein ACYTFT_10360 [Planctomycetota bacterium]|jgi:uncharacterized protein YecE (DUF72 family)
MRIRTGTSGFSYKKWKGSFYPDKINNTFYRMPRASVLEGWATCSSWRAFCAEQAWDEAYVYFKHEDAGIGPKLAQAFVEQSPE